MNRRNPAWGRTSGNMSYKQKRSKSENDAQPAGEVRNQDVINTRAKGRKISHYEKEREGEIYNGSVGRMSG